MQGLAKLSLMLSLGVAIGLLAYSLSGAQAQQAAATAASTPLVKASAPAASASSQAPAKPAASCGPVGDACANQEGATCGVEACGNPQIFCNFLVCSGGRWTALEMPPLPPPRPPPPSSR